MPAASSPTAYSITDDDTPWLENLSRTAPGRHLKEHFQCVDFVIQNKNRCECPVQQVGDFRRVFCRSIASHDRSFGLPRPLPKHIAIVNLSGFRGIMYSSRNSLIRLLCLVGPDSSERVMRNVEQVLEYAAKHNCSVMCCFSLPWQAGVHLMHWEVRTLEIRPDGSVRDGAMCYSYTHEEVRVCAATGETDVGDPAQMKAEMAAMARRFSACNLDTLSSPDEEADAAGDNAAHFQRLKGVISAVQADRSRITGELTALKDDHEAKLKESYRMADERVATVVSKTQISVGVAEKKILELNAKISSLTEENSRLVKDKAEADSRRNEQDLLFGNERASLTTKANLQGMSAKSATDKLSDLQKSSAREREQLIVTHAKQIEDLERRLSDRTVENRKLQRSMEDCAAVTARMDQVIEQMRTEKQALQYETISRRKKVIGLQCALAVACNHHTKSVAAAAIDKECRTDDRCGLQKMLAAAEGAAQSAEASLQLVSKDIDRLKKELEAEKKKKRPKAPSPPPPPLPPPKPAPSEAENQTAPIKSKVDQELEELSERFVALADEKTTWDAQTAQLNQQALDLQAQLEEATVALSQAGSPTDTAHSGSGDTTQFKQKVYNQVYNQVVVPGAQGWPPPPGPADFGSDPNGDQGVEALVAQAQLSMRALVDMARQGCQHKHAADSLWSELQAMKRFSGMDASGQWVAPPPPFYGEMVPMMGQMQPSQWAGQPMPYVMAHGASNGHAPRPKKGGK